MSEAGFHDAWLDTEYLKLDEGALGFVFTRQRLEAALAVEPERVREMLEAKRDELAALYARVTHRILHDEFYTELFEELAELPDEMVFPFIHLVLGRVSDETIEAARVEVVRKFQEKRKRKA
jgi:hypothetical protein